MAFLSAVVGIEDADGVRVDTPSADGTYAPIMLRLGDNLEATAEDNGGTKRVILSSVSGSTELAGDVTGTSDANEVHGLTNVDTNLTFNQAATSIVGIVDRASDGDGWGITVKAGNALALGRRGGIVRLQGGDGAVEDEFLDPGDGGGIVLIGGSGGGTIGNGGTVFIDGGAPAGSGENGSVSIGSASASVGIGGPSTPVNIAGDLLHRPLKPTAIQTGTYAAAIAELVLVDPTGGGFTVNLPSIASSPTPGYCITIKNVTSSTNTVTVDGDGAETIDGAATVAMTTAWGVLRLVSDGTNWLSI